MSVDQIPELMTHAAVADVRGTSIVLITGLALVVILLLRALSASTRDLHDVASTALGGMFRSLGAMLLAAVVLILLVVAAANGTPHGSATSTVAPGQQADAPAADTGANPDGTGPLDPEAGSRPAVG